MREVIARIVDGSDFLEFSAALRRGHGVRPCRASTAMPIGIITNNGPIDPAGANKATHFIQACCQSRHAAALPAEHHRLHRRQGQRAGRHDQARLEDDPGGDQRHRAADHAACAAPASAPATTACAAAPSSRASSSPGPTPRTAVMGGEQAATTMRDRRRGRRQAQGRAGGRGRSCRRMEKQIIAQLRQPVRRLLHQRPAARRRRDRPARHAPGAGLRARHLPRGRGARSCAHAVRRRPSLIEEPPCNTCSTPRTTSRCRTR